MALAASLARFQRGEAGEGRLAREVQALPIAPALRESIVLFVREEGRHARILAAAVHALGGQTLRVHWSDRLFTLARRALPSGDVAAFEVKLAVLLAAEIVGRAYYGLVAARLPSSPLADALTEIARDEDDHLRLHARTLAGRRAPLALTLLATAAGAALVALDHRAAFDALGVGARAWASAIVDGVALAAGRGASRGALDTRVADVRSWARAPRGPGARAG